MAEQSFGPVVVRRRLGAELRRLRERAGLNLDQVAREMEVSPSKLSRVEGGHSPAKLWDVRNLLTLYGVTDDAYRRQAERWVGESKASGWWVPYSDASPADLDHYISLEAESAEIRSYSTPVLYGLLQTERYARALLSAVLEDLSEEALEGLVRIRMRRQDVLTREENPVHLRAIVDETVLLRKIGDQEVMREQWRFLLDLADRIDLRVKRADSVFHRSMAAPFTVFIPQLGDIDPVVVNVEAGFYDAYREEPAETVPYVDAFSSIEESSLTRAQTLDLLNALLRGHGLADVER